MQKKKKFSNKKFKKSLITAKVANRIAQARFVVLYTPSTVVFKGRTLDLNKFSNKILSTFQGASFSFPARCAFFQESGLMLGAFCQFHPLIIKHNNLLLNKVTNVKVRGNFNPVIVLKLFHACLNQIVTVAKFI